MEFNKKILVIEDSQIQRKICVSQLKRAGFNNIEEATNGKVTKEELLFPEDFEKEEDDL